MSTRYKTTEINGVAKVYQESTTYPGSFDVLVAELPANAVPARIGGRTQKKYNREAKRVFSPEQFGTDLYYDPNFRFSIDFNPMLANATIRKSQGFTLQSRFVVQESEYNALSQAEKLHYETENVINGPYEGAKYFESPLTTLEDRYNSVIPSGSFIWIANLETSNEWSQWRYGDAESVKFGYDSWDVAQNRSIVCELDGVTRTLGQLWSSGLWDAEASVRRANRNVLMLKIAKARNTHACQGTSMAQGEPKTNSLTTDDVFLSGSADVSHVKDASGNVIGDSNGNLTINGRSYTGVKGNAYEHETAMLDYFYYFYFGISRSDFNDIFVNKVAGTQNYQYLWSKIFTEHIVAKEKGHWQANRHRMTIPGQTVRGMVRMNEFIYEANAAGIVDGNYIEENKGGEIFRIPFAELQNTISWTDGGTTYYETPKIWIPPYVNYSVYAVARFLAGGTPGSGYHGWNDPGHARYAGTSTNDYNHEFHSITSIVQARVDMQPYERYLAASTLVVDPEVQIGSTGSWSTYSGCDAYALSPDGSRGTQKPTGSLRYLAVDGGWVVLILWGMNQGWTTERYDTVRVPGGLLNGNMFKIKTRGPSAHIFEFFVPSTDSNQTFVADFAATSYEAPAYAGRIQS